MLKAIDEVSSVFGLKPNKTKCIQLSVQETRHIRFQDRKETQSKSKAEHLGTIFHNRANPKLEVSSRMNKAAVGRRRLKTF